MIDFGFKERERVGSGHGHREVVLLYGRAGSLWATGDAGELWKGSGVFREFRQEGDHWMRDIETSDQPVDPANFSVLADDLQADSSWTQSLLQRSSVRTGQTSVTTKVASLSDIGCDKMPLVPTVVHDSSSRGFFLVLP